MPSSADIELTMSSGRAITSATVMAMRTAHETAARASPARSASSAMRSITYHSLLRGRLQHLIEQGIGARTGALLPCRPDIGCRDVAQLGVIRLRHIDYVEPGLF